MRPVKKETMLRTLLIEKGRLRFLEKRDGELAAVEFAKRSMDNYSAYIQAHLQDNYIPRMMAIVYMHYHYVERNANV